MVNFLLQNANGFCLQTMSILSNNVDLAKTNTERARWTSLLGSGVSSYSCRYIQIRKWQIVDSLPGLLRLTEIALYRLNQTLFSFNVGELIWMVLNVFIL